MKLLRVLSACLLGSLFMFTVHAADVPVNGVKRALLVGCTTYPNLDASLQLEGPVNDVHLLQMLLTTRLGFEEKNVAVYTEDDAAAGRLPTRANIEKAFQQLAVDAGPDDQIIILLAGHGSQEPDVNPNPSDPEPDGLDEIFLPRDAAKWNSAKSAVENSIRDDEIRHWIAGILRKGAHVCAMIDACHSGSMIRGAGVERLRQVPPEKLVPEEALREARQAAEKRAASPAPVETKPDPDDLAALPGWVAIYAAQSTEPTVERLLPPRGEGKMYGLLTYTITQIMLNAREPLSYASLGQRVRAQYASWGRTFPTPLVEGTDVDRQVFGSENLARPQPIAFSKVVTNGFPNYVIDRGTMGGLQPGAILALWPAAGEARGEKPLGFLTVRTARAISCDVSPSAFEGQPALEQLPTSGLCEVRQMPEPSVKLRIAAEPGAAERGEVKAALEALCRDPASGFTEAGREQPDWLVRLAGDSAALVPAEGYAGGKTRGLQASGEGPAAFGPRKLDDAFAPWLTETAQRIARAQMLLRLTDPAVAASADGEPPKVRLKLLVGDQPAPATRAGTELHPGEKISFEITNESQMPLDVTLLFLDSGYGISALLPTRGMVEDNRLPPGQSLRTKRFTVTQQTTGLEHAVLLAVKGEGALADFSFLEQPTMPLETTRGATGGGPLRQLIQSAIYRTGKTRGLAPAESAEYAAQALSWRVTPGK